MIEKLSHEEKKTIQVGEIMDALNNFYAAFS